MVDNNIRFLQNNVATCSDYMVTCLESGLELGTDFILFQEPYIKKDGATITHPSYNIILPETTLRPRVAIFHRKLSKFQYCQRNDLSSSDLLVIDILGSQIPNLQLINIYNEKSLEPEIESWTIDRALISLIPSKNTIIGGDFNAHHSWWNSSVSTPIRAQSLISWLKRNKFSLLNQPDIPTFYRKGMTKGSTIDLVFTSIGLKGQYIDWEIDKDLASGSDHEILLFSILESSCLVNNPINIMPYNLEKADWKAFSTKILELEKTKDYQWKYQETGPNGNKDRDSLEIELETEALNLQKMIFMAAEFGIPRRKAFERSKAWWSDKIKELRKSFNQLRRRWKAYPSQDNYKTFKDSKNKYFSEIKTAKTSCWNSFLENAQGKEIFKAFSYTKNKQMPRILILKYNSFTNSTSESESDATTF